MINPLFKKKADAAEFGFDYLIRDEMDGAGNPRAEEPMEAPYAEKGTESTGTDNPVTDEINDHEFFKEGDDAWDEGKDEGTVWGAGGWGGETNPFDSTIAALQALSDSTDNEDIRDTCISAIHDLEFFHKQSKTGAVQSYGTLPPLGANPPSGTSSPQTPTAPLAPKVETPTTKAPAQKAIPGRTLTQQQADTLNQMQQTASRKMAWMPCPSCGETPSGSLTQHIREAHPEQSSRNPNGQWKPGSPSTENHNSTSTGGEGGKAPYGGSYTQPNTSVYPDAMNFPDNNRESRYSFLDDSPEWQQTFDALRHPEWGKLIITLSPQTIASGDGKDVKSLTIAFGRRLLQSFQNKGLSYRVSVRGRSIIVSSPYGGGDKYIGKPVPMFNDPRKMSSKSESEVPAESLGEIQGETGEEHMEEKYIHLQLVGDEAIPTSVVDFELLRKFTGSPSFDIDDYDEVHDKVAEHGYSLEVFLSPDENFGKQATVEMHQTPKMLPPRDDMRSHLDESVKKDVMKGVDKPVKVGTGEDSTTCPNCEGSNHSVVDEEDGEKLIECSDCGSFFTL